MTIATAVIAFYPLSVSKACSQQFALRYLLSVTYFSCNSDKHELRTPDT